jgi:hypothetical protein
VFDLAYIRASYNLDALRKKWSREKGEATGWPAGYYSKSIVIPNTPVVYMSFLDHTDEELRSPANAQQNWYTGMCFGVGQLHRRTPPSTVPPSRR